MVARTTFVKLVFAVLALFAVSQAHAQNELRNTFFKEADAAKAAAEAVDAALLAPRTWERGLKEYTDAEVALERGRNIETVRSNASDAAQYFNEATEKARLARTALAQVMKSRQDAANARAPDLSSDLWQQAQRKFAEAIREAGAEISHTFAVFYYDIFKDTPKLMADMGITLHHLGTWWDILEETRRTRRFDEHTLNEVEKFLNAPYEWSAANGGISQRD